jgi:hypothetical protein
VPATVWCVVPRSSGSACGGGSRSRCGPCTAPAARGVRRPGAGAFAPGAVAQGRARRARHALRQWCGSAATRCHRRRFVLGEAGLAAHHARPRPRQTEARRRHRPADTWGQGRGAGAMAHTPIETSCRSASGCALHTLPGWRSRSPQSAPMTRAGHRTAASRGPSGPGRMMLLDSRRAAPEGADLRRRWMRLLCGDRMPIGRRPWDCDRRLRAGRRGSGGASTDHPSGTQALPRADAHAEPPSADGDRGDAPSSSTAYAPLAGLARDTMLT